MDSEEEVKLDIKDYFKVKNLYSKLEKKEEEQEKEYKDLVAKTKKEQEDLQGLQADIQKIDEDIEKNQKKGEIIQQGQLQQKVEEVVDCFLKDSYDTRHIGKSREIYKIAIQYNNTKMIKTLQEENMTFDKLKNDTKLQYGKEAEEFFFEDQKGNVFLDDLRVIPALFPFSQAVLDKETPVIYVSDIHSGTRVKKKQIVEEAKEEIIEPVKVKKSNLDKFIDFVKSHYKNIFFMVVLLVFLIMWIESCITFGRPRDQRVYKESVKSFFANMIDDMTIQKEAFDEAIKKVKYGVCFILSSMYDALQQKNIIDRNSLMGQFRIIQRRGEENINCRNDRLDIIQDNCPNLFSPIDSSTTQFNDRTFIYKERKVTPHFYAYINEFNDHGYTYDFNFPPDYSIDYDRCTDENSYLELYTLIDSYSASIMITFNLYNFNMESMTIVTVLFEKLQLRWKEFIRTQTINLKYKPEAFTIISIILSVILIFALVLKLIKPDKYAHLTEWEKQLMDSKDYVKEFPLRMPTPIEFILLGSLLLYYATLIVRAAYLGKLRNDPVSTLVFNDYSNIAMTSYVIRCLECISIFLFFLVLIYHSEDFLGEFNIILRTILNYIYELGPFLLSRLILLILVTFYISIFMTGDYIDFKYSYLGFIFMKILQSANKGTMEEKEFTNERVFGEGKVLRNDFELYNSNYNSLYDKIGNFNFIIYNLLFYFAFFIGVKLILISFCYMTYRDSYILTVQEERKRKNELEKKLYLEKVIEKRKEREAKLAKEEEERKKENEANGISLDQGSQFVTESQALNK